MVEAMVQDPGGGEAGTPTPAREWTVMVYLAGDNNLESYGRTDLAEMKAVGSTPQVAVVAQFDRMSEHRARRYYLRQGGTLERDEVPSKLGESNTGDPKELVHFLAWAIKSYPARRYALVLWNHGTGWKEDDLYRLAKSAGLYRPDTERALSPIILRMIERTRRPPLFAPTINAVLARGIGYDDTSCDFLDNAEMKRAIGSALMFCGVDRLDVLGFDACLMNMVEVAYQLRGEAHYVVGSQETEPAEGWPYSAILHELVARPEMDGGELADVIVARYAEAYATPENLTQSALNMEHIRDLVLAVNDVCRFVLDNQSETELAVSRASRSAQRYADPDYKDLHDLMRLIAERASQRALKLRARAVMDLIAPAGPDRFVRAEAHRGVDMARSHGASIYFPGSEVSPFYGRLDFASESFWDDLLGRLFEAR
jgi:hypothetical protein